MHTTTAILAVGSEQKWTGDKRGIDRLREHPFSFLKDKTKC
jgi:hypothetical protein